MKKIIRAVTVSQSCGFFCDVMREMRDMGYEMIALSSPGPELDEINHKDGFRTIAVPMERHISLVKDIKSLFSIINVFRKERPQVVHSMTPKAGLLCMSAAWLARVPIRIHTFTGLVWPTESGMKRKILMLTDKITCACATHIIPEGKGVMNDLKNGGITKKPMKVLGYGNVRGIDLDRFNPARFEKQKSNKFTFLFVGRIVGDKGINELVEAFIQLHKKHKETRLVLVGDQEPELDPLKPQTLKRINEESSILFKGPLSGDTLLKEYVKADCFVMPSYREGFPNTVLEAGAMGIPSIVTDINGSREIIDDGVNGLIVPSKDIDTLCNAMKTMIEDNPTRKSMAAVARQMIASRFEQSYVRGCLYDFYNEILEKNV